MKILEEIKEIILAALPDAKTYVLDPQNDGTHLLALVISPSFRELSRIEQQQLVMQPLSSKFSTSLHALALSVPKSGKKKNIYTTEYHRKMNDTESIQEEIRKDIAANKIILYMKGTKSAPQCGFSAHVVDLLNRTNCDYVTRNVLENPALREGIKIFSNWPTVPQLYVNAQFIGGCDIISEMHEDGELEEALGK